MPTFAPSPYTPGIVAERLCPEDDVLLPERSKITPPLQDQRPLQSLRPKINPSKIKDHSLPPPIRGAEQLPAWFAGVTSSYAKSIGGGGWSNGSWLARLGRVTVEPVAEPGAAGRGGVARWDPADTVAATSGWSGLLLAELVVAVAGKDGEAMCSGDSF